MDVVGDDSVVNLVYSGNFIETDKKRTLGADDKAGIAEIMTLMSLLSSSADIPHGKICVAFS